MVSLYIYRDHNPPRQKCACSTVHRNGSDGAGAGAQPSRVRATTRTASSPFAISLYPDVHEKTQHPGTLSSCKRNGRSHRHAVPLSSFFSKTLWTLDTLLQFRANDGTTSRKGLPVSLGLIFVGTRTTKRAVDNLLMERGRGRKMVGVSFIIAGEHLRTRRTRWAHRQHHRCVCVVRMTAVSVLSRTIVFRRLLFLTVQPTERIQRCVRVGKDMAGCG